MPGLRLFILCQHRLRLLQMSALLLAPGLPAVAVAQVLPTASATPDPAPAPAAPIETAADPQADARVAARIRDIFAQIRPLRTVRVAVSAGVVTLDGTVADQAAIDQAAAIAGRVSGVVTVQNGLTRDLQVERNLDPALSGMGGKVVALWRAAPLIGVAVLVAVLVGMLGYLIARQRAVLRRLAPNPFLADLAATAIRFVFVVGGVVLALDIVGATALLGAVLGGAGVIGLALGFAVRDSVDNYVSSLMLSVRQPFRARDWVRIDEHEGSVLRLTSRATILLTADGNHLRIPNSTVFKAVIQNFTTNPQRRFTFDYPVAPEADPCRALAVGLLALSTLDFVLETPAPLGELADYAGSGTVLRFSGWVDQTHSDFGKARTGAMEAVRRALRAAGFAAVAPVTQIRIDRPPRESDTAPAPPPVSPPVSPSASPDLSPDRPVQRMVAKERADAARTGDLLDASRPTE